MKFYSPPYEFEAVQWKGDNLEQVQTFCGTRPTGDWDIDANKPHVIELFNPIGTYLIPSEKNEGATGEVWDVEAGVWLPVNTGDWVVPQEDGFVACTDEWLHLNKVELTPEMEELLAERERPKSFDEELISLLNKHSRESFSGTPDWILGEYLRMCLRTWDLTSKMRSDWRSESVELPALQSLRQNTETRDRFVAHLRKLVEEGVITIRQPLEATDLYRELADYQPPEPLDALAGSEAMAETGEHIQAGFEAGLSQGPDEVYAPGALDKNDGKEVPLVIYTEGQRKEIGTANVTVAPGAMSVSGTITGALPVFEQMLSDPNAAYSIAEPKDEQQSTSRFDRYQKRGLTENG